MKLCSTCFKALSKNNQKKNFNRKANQLCNEQDQTAAESEVDQALEDTRCQSSLLTSQRNQYAPSSIFNEDNQINTFQHKSQIFTGEQNQPNLRKRVLKQMEKQVDSQLKVIQAEQNIVLPLVEAPNKDFQS